MRIHTILIGIGISLLLLTLPAAASEDYTLEIFGNANEDETINMQDVTYTELIILEYRDETELSDAKHDGKINMQDVTQIELVILGRELELSFIDCDGESATVHKPIESMVVVYYSHAEAIRVLGAKDKVVGIDDSILWYPTFFPDLIGKPCVGDRSNLDIEAILELKPDIVVLGSGQYHTPGLEDKLEGTGVDVVRWRGYFKPDIMAEGFSQLGYILDEEENAREFIGWIEQYINRIQEEVSEVPGDEKPTVFIDAGYSKYKPGTATYAGGSGPDISVELAGGRSIAHDLPGDAIIDAETEWVIDQNPEVIIGREYYEAYGLDDVSEIKTHYEAILGVPGFDHTEAVEDDRVYMIKSIILWGPAYLVGVTHLAKWLHPDLFEDLDPQAVHQEYIDRFQGIDFDVSEQGVFVYHPEEHPDGR